MPIHVLVIGRIRHLKSCLLLFVSLSLFAIYPAHAQEKPNMVIFLADDLNQSDVACYGNPDVKTPHIDALAAEGMRFNRAYAASPMCAPSRSALFTGLYPFRNGSQMNHFTVRANTANLPQFLQQQGYRVVIAGKTDVFPAHNFPFERIGEEFGRYAPVENRLDRKQETVQFIASHFKERPQQPVCLIVAPWVPHVPWFPNRDFDAATVKLPNYLVNTKATRKALTAYYQSIGEADKMLGEVLQAIDQAGQKNSTMVMFISDQGAQFPSAKWTVYDQGLRVPMIVRWPGKVAPGSTSDALVSLVDVTPTLVDIGGGKERKELDGSSIRQVLLNKKKDHHAFIFAETSVEPHFWYNYTPSRSLITAEGYHYIKNYHPGARFITHIDKVEQNEFYFDSWEEAAKTDTMARFLLNRYSYHPPEELFDLNTDRNEFTNLVATPAYNAKASAMRQLLDKELKRQGETDEMIRTGPLPIFFDHSYAIPQHKSAADLSFNKKLWNTDTLIISAYLGDIDKGGVVCDYFNNFNLYVYHNRLGLLLPDGTEIASAPLGGKEGQLRLRVTASGTITAWFGHQQVLDKAYSKDLTKIKGGYVTCGKLQGEEKKAPLQTYQGTITDLRFTMNE